MIDHSLAGTQRMTARVAAYDHGRTPADGEPDRIVEVEVYLEADGQTPVTDPARIAAIRAAQDQQAEETSNGRAGYGESDGRRDGDGQPGG